MSLLGTPGGIIIERDGTYEMNPALENITEAERLLTN